MLLTFSFSLGFTIVKVKAPRVPYLRGLVELVKITKAGKGFMEDFTGLSDKAIQRLREYLLGKGWTADEILDLLDYITK